MIPPFVPDLSQNNFDDEDIKVDIQYILDKIQQDKNMLHFETHFSEEFVFINPTETLTFLSKCSQRQPEPHFTGRKQRLAKSSSAPTMNKNKFSILLPFRNPFKRNNHSLDKNK